MNSFLLSIVVPVYNEENTITIILNKINEEIKKIKEFSFEIIVINDNSNDKTLTLLEENKNLYDIKVKRKTITEHYIVKVKLFV
jgi:dolichol-phosphate mannosyltransferase